MTDTERAIYTSALSKWGTAAQTLMVYEEMAELQKELCKHARGRHNTSAIAEEIADVLIMLDQMMVLHNCEETVADMKCAKLERLVRQL